jgi:hypothetical protein
MGFCMGLTVRFACPQNSGNGPDAEMVSLLIVMHLALIACPKMLTRSSYLRIDCVSKNWSSSIMSLRSFSAVLRALSCSSGERFGLR